MSDNIYRIDRTQANPTDEDLWQHLIGRGVLVPVERCEHGRFDGHWVTGPCLCYQYHPATKERGLWGPRGIENEYAPVRWEPCTHEWCPGSPTLEVTDDE